MSHTVGILSGEQFDKIRDDLAISTNELRERLRSMDTLNKLHVDQLKKILKVLKQNNNNITLAGNKPALVDRIFRCIHYNQPPPPAPTSAYNLPNIQFRIPSVFNSTNGTSSTSASTGNTPASSTQSLLFPSTFNFPGGPPLTVPITPTSTIAPPLVTNSLAHVPPPAVKITARKSTAATRNYIINWNAFNEKQSILFESVKVVGHYPIHKGTTGYQDFYLDNDAHSKITAKPPPPDSDELQYFIHLRLIQNATNLTYSSDMKLAINENSIALPYKLRNPSGCTPYIVPKPLDITSFVKKDRNRVVFSAPARTEGVLVIQFVKTVPIKNIVEKIIKKESLDFKGLLDLKKKDSDIEELSYDISIRCPLSFIKISCPVRTKTCTHIQCFDLKFYLQYSFQQQIWNCPVCNSFGPAENLVYDKYTAAIIKELPEDVSNFTIQQDGSWSIRNETAIPIKTEKKRDDEDQKKTEPTEANSDPLHNGNGGSSDVFDVDSMMTPTPPVNTDASDIDFDFDYDAEERDDGDEGDEDDGDGDEDDDYDPEYSSYTPTTPPNGSETSTTNNKNNSNHSLSNSSPVNTNNSSSNLVHNNHSHNHTNNPPLNGNDDDCIVISDDD